MVQHRIKIAHARRVDDRGRASGQGMYRVTHNGAAIGVWRVPECSAARWLLDLGIADRADTLQTFRGDTPCLTGGVGWLADHTVKEDQKTSPIWVRWKPFVAGAETTDTELDEAA